MPTDAIGGATDISVASLRKFRDQVDGLGLWKTALLAVAAIRKDGRWFTMLFKTHLVAPGAYLPSSDHLFDATTEDVLVRTRELALQDFWNLLTELTGNDTALLSALIGQKIENIAEKTPANWSFNTSSTHQRRLCLDFSRWSGIKFYEYFGHELYERIGAQLRNHRPPYNSLRDISDGMAFLRGAGCDTNNANPVFEVTAEFPIDLTRWCYNPAVKGIELELMIGKDVPGSALSVAVTPEPRRCLIGTEFSASLSNDIRTLTKVVECDEPQSEVEINVQYSQVPIAHERVPPAQRAAVGVDDLLGVGPEPWISALEATFHWQRSVLRRRLRTVLRGPAAELAESRIRDSILMADAHPFFAVVSAASVAELLLRERLAMVPRRTRTRRWTELRQQNARLPRKLPNDRYLKFDDAIQLAQRLGFLGTIDSNAVNLLRIARNHIHIDGKSKPTEEEFSPARSAQALLATLDLCKIVATVKRAKR